MKRKLKMLQYRPKVIDGCLAGTDLPLTRISTLLGFAEQATFTRSCRRWWGTTPTAVRRGRPGDGDGHHAALSATAP